MKPVVQTRTGAAGNCFAACLASILEIPLKRVPDFSDAYFFEEAAAFLAMYGLSYRRVPMYKKPDGWSTIEGISPRGGLHACVALDGELVWDPHPIDDGTGQGLVEPRYYGLLEPLKSKARDDFGSRIKSNAAAAGKVKRGMTKGAESGEVRALRADIASRKRALPKVGLQDLSYARERIATQEEKLRRLLGNVTDHAKDAVSRASLEKTLEIAKRRYDDQRGRVGMAEERRKMKGQRLQSSAEQAARSKLSTMYSEVYRAEQELKNFSKET